MLKSLHMSNVRWHSWLWVPLIVVLVVRIVCTREWPWTTWMTLESANEPRWRTASLSIHNARWTPGQCTLQDSGDKSVQASWRNQIMSFRSSCYKWALGNTFTTNCFVYICTSLHCMHSFNDENGGIKLDPYTSRPTARTYTAPYRISVSWSWIPETCYSFAL